LTGEGELPVAIATAGTLVSNHHAGAWLLGRDFRRREREREGEAAAGGRRRFFNLRLSGIWDG